MKKHHDTTGLANELEGASVFFQEPHSGVHEPESPPPADTAGEEAHSETKAAIPAGPPSERSTDRPSDRPTGRSVLRRQTQRRAFEFYRDQLQTFKAWAAVDLAEGGEGNMSDWAREAFDDYIEKRNGRDRPSDRPADPPTGRSTDRPVEDHH